MAYIDQGAVIALLDQRLDLLITHQGPSGLQGEKGSETLQFLLEAGVAWAWFHGHSIPNPEITRAGPDGRTLVVPLGDVAFPGEGPEAEDPGKDGWARIRLGQAMEVQRERPVFWRDYRRRKWKELETGVLVAPDLVP